MIGLILLIISTIIKMALSPFLYIYGILFSLIKGQFNQYNRNLAIGKDQYGNALGKYLFNQILITSWSQNYFGNIDETISSVIGKNKRDGTLTKTGKVLDKILNAIDPNHSIRSIDENVHQLTKTIKK